MHPGNAPFRIGVLAALKMPAYRPHHSFDEVHYGRCTFKAVRKKSEADLRGSVYSYYDVALSGSG
jgi:hypothetical protein